MHDFLIEAAGLTRTFEMGSSEVRALRGVDLAIRRGEFVAIMGPSGSGKSTLMNLLGCLDTPSEGSYRLAGEEVSGLSDDRLAEIRNRRIGFVFQTFNLLPRYTALGNVELPLVYAGVGRTERRRLATSALERVDLGDRMTHRPGQMSGGERQRTAVARALIARPAVVLADEPTGNLDHATGEKVFDLMLDLNREFGASLVVVTHDTHLAARLDRTVVLEDGLLVDSGAG